MAKLRKTIQKIITLSGLYSLINFFYGFWIISKVKPKMIQFQEIPSAEEKMMIFFCFGLLIFAFFCFLMLLRIVQFIRFNEKTQWFHYGWVLGTVLAILCVFGDATALSDIGKQYEHGLSQPEWSLLLLMTGGQVIANLSLLFIHFRKLKSFENKKATIFKDINIFILTQYIGLICGLLGLTVIILNFFFPTPLWMMQTNLVITTLFLLAPYIFIVGYWFLIKLQERDQDIYDEKQLNDLGQNALITLPLILVIMGFIYLWDFGQFSGWINVHWFPSLLFLILTVFSLGNIIRNI